MKRDLSDLDDFLDYLRTRGTPPGTPSTATGATSASSSNSSTSADVPEAADNLLIRGFMADLYERRLKKSTLGRKLAAVRSFFDTR